MTGTVSTQYDNIGCHGDKDYYAINMVGLLDKIFTNLESLEVIKGSAINEKVRSYLLKRLGPEWWWRVKGWMGSGRG